jgi:predicted MPP superfamily phosphohydrolase
MGGRPHYFAEFIVWLLCLAVLTVMYRWAREEKSRNIRRIGYLALGSILVWLTAGLALSIFRIAIHFPNLFVVWFRGGAIGLAACLLCAFLIMLVSRILMERILPIRKLPPFDPERRQFLAAATAGAIMAPVAVGGFAFVRRNDLTLKEFNVVIPNLARDLDGLRLVQISDIHLSPFLPESVLARAIDMANETRAHIGLVTGDLITRASDPLDVCFRQLKRLRVDSEILGCLGNHEVYAGSEDDTTEMGARQGIQFLRHQSRMLQFGSARLNFAGVDYQSSKEPYLVGAEQLVVPEVTNILLSHNPDVFPVAARQGYDLTIAGHTHGGQVNMEILHQNMNLVRFITPYIYGIYKEGKSSIFVTRGIGTVGLPARLGAPPEVALIRLCAT